MCRWYGPTSLVISFLVSVLCLANPVRGQQAPSVGVDPAKAGEALAHATAAIAAACRNDAALHGAWVRLEPDEQASTATEIKFQARVLVDADREQEQLPQVEKLLTQLPLGHSPRIVAPIHRAPLSRMVPLLQAAAVRAAGKPGCFVRGAYYGSQKDPEGNENLVVMPYGRLEKASQGDAVVTRFARETGGAEWDDYQVFAGTSPRPVLDRLLIRGASARLVQAYRGLDDALSTDPILKGARIELVECLDHLGEFAHYDVYQYVTEDRAEAQRTRLAALLEQRLGGDHLVMADEALPLARLIHRLNLSIESRATLNGCWVDGAYFTGEYSQLPVSGEPPAEALVQRQAKLVLEGQIAAEQPDKQREWISELAGAFVQLDPDWRNYAGEFAVMADGMTEMASSLGRGQALFCYGVEVFRSGCYEEAWRAFHYASLEVPDSLPYRYWRILAELQLGRTEDALDHMVAVVGRDMTATMRRQVVTSLHRIQGPLRVELLRLEARARFEYYDRRHDMLLGSFQAK
jgi:hypothetical protein